MYMIKLWIYGTGLGLFISYLITKYTSETNSVFNQDDIVFFIGMATLFTLLSPSFLSGIARSIVLIFCYINKSYHKKQHKKVKPQKVIVQEKIDPLYQKALDEINQIEQEFIRKTRLENKNEKRLPTN